RGREKPEHRVVETTLRLGSPQISTEHIGVDGTLGPHGLGRQASKDRLATCEDATVEVGLAVACLEVGEIARLAGGHDALRRSATTRTVAVARSSPARAAPATSAIAANGTVVLDTPNPMVMGVMRDLLPGSHDKDGPGPPTIGRRDHFSASVRTSTSGWSPWYERTIGCAVVRH